MTIASANLELCSPGSPLVCCVVVNWNGWRDTVECLNSLQRQEYDNLQVIVVDNGSTDGSSRKIQAAHPWTTVIETGRNLGFSSGCNVGTRLALQTNAEYVWLLNNDTIAPPDTTRKLVRTAQQNPNAGAVGAILYYMHDPKQVQAWGGGRINLWTGFVSHFDRPTRFSGNAYLTGASLLLPREICEEVGIFYEGFFMYCDDSDLCIRIRRAGYDLVVAEDTAILHKEGASSPKRSPLMDRFVTTSGMRLLKRQASLPGVSIVIFLCLRIANRIVRAEWKNLSATWNGIGVYVRERKQIYAERV
jgi:GT2 family glycosyltransferase